MDKFWIGPAPERCDICEADLIPAYAGKGVFIDGATSRGPWACMCTACFTHYGVGLGTGRGQKYERQIDERWKKVEG